MYVLADHCSIQKARDQDNEWNTGMAHLSPHSLQMLLPFPLRSQVYELRTPPDSSVAADGRVRGRSCRRCASIQGDPLRTLVLW